MLANNIPTMLDTPHLAVIMQTNEISMNCVTKKPMS